MSRWLLAVLLWTCLAFSVEGSHSRRRRSHASTPAPTSAPDSRRRGSQSRRRGSPSRTPAPAPAPAPRRRRSHSWHPAPAPSPPRPHHPAPAPWPHRSGHATFTCGAGVPLCGYLVLESGLGTHAYAHHEPTVHGLWPETRPYGNSKCIRPHKATDPNKVYGCYRGELHTPLSAGDLSHVYWFEDHEWEKHGECAGVANADDFFSQVCALSSRPLRIMEAVKDGGGNLNSMVSRLRASSFFVAKVDRYHSQVYLSACAGYDGKWKLAPPSQFPQYCASYTAETLFA